MSFALSEMLRRTKSRNVREMDVFVGLEGRMLQGWYVCFVSNKKKFQVIVWPVDFRDLEFLFISVDSSTTVVFMICCSGKAITVLI